MTYDCAAITTTDNPFDPFDEFIDWYKFDCDKGYYTCDYLGRLAKTSDSLSDVEYSQEVERAIDSIILYDPLKIYKKVKQTITIPD